MGYSARYHAASLAAVFLALAVGILIGVGFGSDIVNGTADEPRGQPARRHRRLPRAGRRPRGSSSPSERRVQPPRRPGGGRRTACGAARSRSSRSAGSTTQLADDVRGALEPAGGQLQEVAVVREPPDAGALADAPSRQPSATRPASEALDRASRRAGRSLVRGGKGFADLRAALFTRYSGEPGDDRRGRRRPRAPGRPRRARRRDTDRSRTG